jgi:hypothetical protein
VQTPAHISPTPARRVIRILLVGVIALVGGVLGVRFALDQIAPDCEWSDDQRETVEAAPLDYFAGISGSSR